MTPLSTLMREALAAGRPAVLVRVGVAKGSTPREEGAAMLVTEAGVAGTVGGGRLELSGIEAARGLIASGAREVRLAVPLGPRIGQCCGGHVTLHLARLDADLLLAEEALERAAEAARPLALVFGAGHTGRALAQALAPLPIRLCIVDPRPESLLDLPPAAETRAVALPEGEVERAPPGSAFVVMTHDHPLDFLIAAAALRRRDAVYVGMIGSATKREKFRRHLRETGEDGLIAGLTLPIGGAALRDKRPPVIAALTAAELVRCLLSNQRDLLINRLAEADAQCHSAAIRSSG
ncbi:xanthine dehydrogenase accessory protein XdhC [Aureimonas endophytica]|uniref:Xanthine dehydrogenase accessory protein XdhC n=1 Tax=Aureimonas endophytica TaxID=2027858 RepID=A0A917A052_9HYPH|nr:xanthine dehydrogenase accessory protein XdhC [Aureimonas endophytica]GGE20703.1 xanthine dehydrogenase accessory protein XdhC [Aureimonas endophytica]